MNQPGISRRELFGRLLAPAEKPARRPAQPPQIVPTRSVAEAYLDVLDRHRDALPFGVAERELPETPEAIKEALVEALPPQAGPALREALRDAYASLVWFTGGEELECMHAGRRAFESSDESEEGKKALVAAFAIRAAKVREMAALGKEFDERVTARYAATKNP